MDMDEYANVGEQQSFNEPGDNKGEILPHKIPPYFIFVYIKGQDILLLYHIFKSLSISIKSFIFGNFASIFFFPYLHLQLPVGKQSGQVGMLAD